MIKDSDNFKEKPWGFFMRSIIFICLISFISCNSTINQPESIQENAKLNSPSLIGEYKTTDDIQRIEIGPKKNALTFFNIFGDSAQIRLTGSNVNPILNIDSKNINVNGCLTANKIKGEILSNNNNPGKTYTEEFEDKQGNLRTRVYENGLLVSYKINGVEQ